MDLKNSNKKVLDWNYALSNTIFSKGLGRRWRMATVADVEEKKELILKHLQLKTINIYRMSKCQVYFTKDIEFEYKWYKWNFGEKIVNILVQK